jgi:hypothetical protein
MTTEDSKYADIADAIRDAANNHQRGRLTLDEVDAIMRQHGVETVERGRAGRGDWNSQRRMHRARTNKCLRQKYDVTLEVVAHEGRGRPIYGLIHTSDKIVSRPFQVGAAFYRQMERHFKATKRLWDSAFPPPADLDEAGTRKWNELSEHKFRLSWAQWFTDLEMNTMRQGLERHMPDLPREVIDFREALTARQRANSPARKQKHAKRRA